MSSRASRRLSPAAAAVLLGLFVVVALAVWALGRGGGAAATTATRASTAATGTAQVGTAPVGTAPVGTAPVGTAPAARSAAIRSSTAAGGVLREPGSGASVETKARYVLSVLDATGRPPSGYVGGRQFMNDGRGGTSALPRQDGAGRALTYHEYDVNPKLNGVNRGPERLVVGSDRSAFWTADHYVTWTRLR